MNVLIDWSVMCTSNWGGKKIISLLTGQVKALNVLPSCMFRLPGNLIDQAKSDS